MLSEYARKTIPGRMVATVFAKTMHGVIAQEGKDLVAISNPISSEMTHMRPSIIPGLLMAARKNQNRGNFDLRFFEIGSSFKGSLPDEEFVEASGVLIGNILGRNVYEPSRTSDFFDIKNHVLNILNALNVPIGRLSFNRGTPNYYHPQRSAVISLGPKIVLGRLGEMHPTIMEQFDLKGRAYSFSIFPENGMSSGWEVVNRVYRKFSTLPQPPKATKRPFWKLVLLHPSSCGVCVYDVLLNESKSSHWQEAS